MRLRNTCTHLMAASRDPPKVAPPLRITMTVAMISIFRHPVSLSRGADGLFDADVDGLGCVRACKTNEPEIQTIKTQYD